MLVTSQPLTVRVRPGSWNRGRIQFIRSGGRLLKESVASSATYELTGDEG